MNNEPCKNAVTRSMDLSICTKLAQKAHVPPMLSPKGPLHRRDSQPSSPTRASSCLHHSILRSVACSSCLSAEPACTAHLGPMEPGSDDRRHLLPQPHNARKEAHAKKLQRPASNPPPRHAYLSGALPRLHDHNTDIFLGRLQHGLCPGRPLRLCLRFLLLWL